MKLHGRLKNIEFERNISDMVKRQKFVSNVLNYHESNIYASAVTS